MSNWFKNLFKGKCSCHKEEECCQEEKQSPAQERPDVNSVVTPESAPIMPETPIESDDKEVIE